jgi:hypothetical protein
MTILQLWEPPVTHPLEEIGEDFGDDIVFVSDSAASADEVTTREPRDLFDIT